MSHRLAFAVLFAALLAGGCGTICGELDRNRAGGSYLGVATDLEACGTILNGSPAESPAGHTAGDAVGALAFAFWPVLDLPFSFVADTLLLPFKSPEL